MKWSAGLERFALDCGFWRALKWSGRSLGAIGLQACAVSYCNENLTDGLLPGPVEDLAAQLGLRPREVAKVLPELLERSIWREHGDGFEIVGFLDHNPSRAEVEGERRKKQRAAAVTNHRRWHGKEADPMCDLCSDQTSDQTSDRSSDQTTDAPAIAGRTRRVENVEKYPPNPPSTDGSALPDGGGGGGGNCATTTAAVLAYWAQAELETELRSGNHIRSRDNWLRSKLESLGAEHGERIDKLLVDDSELTPSTVLSVMVNPDFARTYFSGRERRAAGE